MNYPGLRQLLERYGEFGFNVAAFPCNQFGGQAPLSSEEEREFAYKKFGVRSFPIFDKIEVNGPGAHPAYKFLKAEQPVSLPTYIPGPAGGKGELEWNYVKFLIDRSGRAVRRYTSTFDPLKFERDVQLCLAGRELDPTQCLKVPGASECLQGDLPRSELQS